MVSLINGVLQFTTLLVLIKSIIRESLKKKLK